VKGEKMKRFMVPSADELHKIAVKTLRDAHWDNYLQKAHLEACIVGFISGIAYANVQYEEESDMDYLLKAPIEEIREGLKREGIDTSRLFKFLKDLISETEAPKPWTPQPGDKCAFWNKDDKHTMVGIFDLEGDDGTGRYLYSTPERAYSYCALLESLDEIGKPPQYFIERGWCTVCV
jgi:hypothetical protein